MPASSEMSISSALFLSNLYVPFFFTLAIISSVMLSFELAVMTLNVTIKIAVTPDIHNQAEKRRRILFSIYEPYEYNLDNQKL